MGSIRETVTASLPSPQTFEEGSTGVLSADENQRKSFLISFWDLGYLHSLAPGRKSAVATETRRSSLSFLLTSMKMNMGVTLRDVGRKDLQSLAATEFLVFFPNLWNSLRPFPLRLGGGSIPHTHYLVGRRGECMSWNTTFCLGTTQAELRVYDQHAPSSAIYLRVLYCCHHPSIWVLPCKINSNSKVRSGLHGVSGTCSFLGQSFT